MHYDILIVGGGIVGSTLALALAKTTSLSIALLETQAATVSWSKATHSHRVSAIALSSVRIFKAIDVWSQIAKARISAFNNMSVWDAMGHGEVHFHCGEIAENTLGYIIENDLIADCLDQQLKNYPSVKRYFAVNITQLTQTDAYVEVQLQNGSMLTTKLLIGADGAQSWVRKQTNIQLTQFKYAQNGIVATIRTTKNHENTARQVFLQNGPLAFLPLQDQRLCSIVWTVDEAQSQQLMACSAVDFQAALQAAFGDRLGGLVLESERYTFPLAYQHAHQYMDNRIVLVGDAAHTVHPLAGLGVNIGLLDAASLVEIIRDALDKRKDFSSRRVLRAYERWRLSDNFFLLKGIDCFQKIFSTEHQLVKNLRAFGLNVTDQVSLVKRYFMNQAVGNRNGMPKLASE